MHKPIHPLALICLTLCTTTCAWAAVLQGGMTIFGRVYLPDGQPAVRAKVKVEIVNGLVREVWSDDQGNYEFRGMPAGRYRLSATNPEAAEQYSEPAESDSTRSYANRLHVNVYLRLPTEHGKAAPPGVVSVAEAAQNIPKAARNAYEQGLKSQKENQAEKALAAFDQAIELYPEYFQALAERGNLRMARNRLLDAAADFERALELNGKYVPALRGLGYCQLQQKQFAAGVANLERAYALAPNVALTLLLLGYGNLSLNRHEAAKQCLREALRLDPAGAARAHVYLAEVFAHEGKFKEAADAIRAYLKVKPDAADAAKLKEMEADWRARGKPSKDRR
jgi:tetratricopeptide (TPR) repeat protein